ncbi:hypothetical protein HBI78_036300 [Parastagonospora nodorum]|nr:hypothetical protein HBI78_036300 [Parastagonospora nodorum]
MQFALFLVLTALTMTMAEDIIRPIDFTAVAPCAVRCPALIVAQEHCMGVVPTISDQEAYDACFCDYPQLDDLRNNADVCSKACDANDQNRIYTLFTRRCRAFLYTSLQLPALSTQETIPSTILESVTSALINGPESVGITSATTPTSTLQSPSASSSTSEPILTPTSSPITLVSTLSLPVTSAVTSSSLSSALISSLKLTSTPSSSSPPSKASTTSLVAIQPTTPHTSSPPKDHGAWLHGNWQYLVAAGVCFILGIIILLATAIYLHYRNTKAKARCDDSNGVYLLGPLPGLASQSRSSELAHRATVPASPLAWNHQDSFGPTLREHARQEQEREAGFRARREAGIVPPWRLPRQQGKLDDE